MQWEIGISQNVYHYVMRTCNKNINYPEGDYYVDTNVRSTADE